MNNSKNQRDLTVYAWLLGLLIVCCFASSIYLGRISIDIQSDLARLAREFPTEKEKEILDKTATFGERLAIVKHAVGVVAIFLALPFGWLLRLRYFDKNLKENSSTDK
ncbi:MAG: hypothetical protein EA353_04605 [Puniceicoccaceae bacterium]|nr:MAG: hypothetical protein EA353_04605 [Puniceicoccaceae bacterium]